uniref:Fork-head domain-containing protein n=1 Tax=Mola mola TaxID=94237 RepID=A0A3Q3XI80_MOLML
MPETFAESKISGQQQAQAQRCKKIKELEMCPPPPPCLPPPPPPPPHPTPQSRAVVSPVASGSQSWNSMEVIRQRQQRPSVLRQVSQSASRQQRVQPENNAAISICKEELDASYIPKAALQKMSSSPRQSNHNLFPLRRDGPKQSSTEARLNDGVPGGTSTLFVSGLCRWPGCDAMFEDFPSFLEHLNSEHSHDDRSIAQWKIQQDIVQCMESQLIVEKQKLFAMQLHLHLSENKYTDLTTASEQSHNLLLFLPQPLVTDKDGVQQWGIQHLSQHGYRANGSAHFLPDLVPSLECYKYNNIRPPYTYAYLIRWAILESPDKQCTLNEIYNWFITMFFYFRHNSATWKNAVRHNLSLHKCFVRVEGGKGAVWTVDETEYQRRKGQKYYRDCPVKWLKSFYSPEDS